MSDTTAALLRRAVQIARDEPDPRWQPVADLLDDTASGAEWIAAAARVGLDLPPERVRTLNHALNRPRPAQ